MIVFSLSVILNHWCQIYLFSVELGTREFRLRPLTFALLPGCLMSRDKGAWLNASKSRDVCSKSMGSVIFFHKDRKIKSRVRSRSKFTNQCFFSTKVARYKIMRRFRDLISREFSPCRERYTWVLLKKAVNRDSHIASSPIS